MWCHETDVVPAPLLLLKLDNFPNTFLFEKENHHHRSRRESVELTQRLSEDKRIVWAEQQVIHRRVKRNRANPTAGRFFVPDPQGRGAAPSLPSSRSRFNDELWSYQWYIRKTANVPTLPQVDLNIEQVWAMGFTGKGVVLSVIDDGNLAPVAVASTEGITFQESNITTRI